MIGVMRIFLEYFVNGFRTSRNTRTRDFVILILYEIDSQESACDH